MKFETPYKNFDNVIPHYKGYAHYDLPKLKKLYPEPLPPKNFISHKEPLNTLKPNYKDIYPDVPKLSGPPPNIRGIGPTFINSKPFGSNIPYHGPPMISFGGYH